MAEREQLFEQDRDLLAVRRGQRVELQRMALHRQLLLVRRTGDRTVDVGEGTAAGLGPGPDLRGHVVLELAMFVSASRSVSGRLKQPGDGWT